MQLAKLSTARTLIIGPVLDSAGAEYTGAVIGDISISKNGGTLTALASAATLTHIANGQYTLVLTTGNTDTLGCAQFLCNKSTYQCPMIELSILPATVYSALIDNAVNATGGLTGATGAITGLAGVIATTTNITSATGVDITKILGTAISTPATAGILDVNVKNIDNDAASASGTVTFPNATLASTTNITAAAGCAVSSIGANVITAASAAADFGAEIQALITGGAYDLDTDANGRIRIVDGTGAGEINTNAGAIALVDLVTLTSTSTNLTNLPAITANWLTAAGTAADFTTEIQAGLSTLTGAQAATAVWQDTTAGDFTVASSMGKALYIANVAPGAAGGHFIAGSNAATTLATLTVSGATTLTGNVGLAAGLTITQSTTNGHGISVTGNGTGSGVSYVGGATGNGATYQGGATSGSGFYAYAPGTTGISNYGFWAEGDDAGAYFDGGTYGAYLHGSIAMYANGTDSSVSFGASNGGIEITSSNDKAGIYIEADGHGLDISGGTGFQGFKFTGPSGNTINAGLTAGVSGLTITGRTSGAGLKLVGGSAGPGLWADGGSSTGDGFLATSTGGSPIVGNLLGNITGTITTTTNLTNLPAITANWITAAGTAADFIAEVQAAVTGGAYTLSTDANGRIRIVDGTAAGEIDTSSGAIAHVILTDTTTNLTNAATGDSSGTTTLLSRLTSTRAGYLDNLSAGAVATAASITALNNLSAAQVNAEVLDVINVDTWTIPGQGTPTATPTIAEMLRYRYKLDTNPIDQSSTLQRVYNRAGSVVDQKRTVSDLAGLTTSGALVTGP